MIIVCDKHVKNAVKMFKCPHVSRLADYTTKCYFCKKDALYRLYYHDIQYRLVKSQQKNA